MPCFFAFFVPFVSFVVSLFFVVFSVSAVPLWLGLLFTPGVPGH
jgi:hypothetical protein